MHRGNGAWLDAMDVRVEHEAGLITVGAHHHAALNPAWCLMKGDIATLDEEPLSFLPEIQDVATAFLLNLIVRSGGPRLRQKQLLGGLVAATLAIGSNTVIWEWHPYLSHSVVSAA